MNTTTLIQHIWHNSLENDLAICNAYKILGGNGMILTANETRRLCGFPEIHEETYVKAESQSHTKITNCPNCGAVITAPKCEYCDTRFNLAIVEGI